jgi:hypothetical protein
VASANGQRQVTGQAGNAGQTIAVAHADHQRHRAALREAGDHDPLRRDAPAVLAGDQRLDPRLRVAQPGLVLSPGGPHADNVVPGPHHVAAVDGHRAQRSVRQDVANRAGCAQVERPAYRDEVGAVRAQPVQHQHAGGGFRPGFDLDRRIHPWVSRSCAGDGRPAGRA